MKSHLCKNTCDFCGKSYSRLSNLLFHQNKVHGIQKHSISKCSSFLCDVCGKSSNKRYHLGRHMSCVHKKGRSQRPQRQFACRHCDRVFQNYDNLFQHVTENHPFNRQEGGRSAPNPRSLYENQTAETGQQRLSLANDVNETDNNAEEHQQPLEETAIGNGVVNKYLMPTGNEKYDVLAFFANVRGQIQSFLQYRVLLIGGIKWNLCVQVELRRDDAEGDANTSPYFRSQTYMTLSAEDFAEHDLNEAMQKMYASLEQFMREGSGWYVNKVLKLEIHTVTYKPIRASTYLPLP